MKTCITVCKSYPSTLDLNNLRSMLALPWPHPAHPWAVFSFTYLPQPALGQSSSLRGCQSTLPLPHALPLDTVVNPPSCPTNLTAVFQGSMIKKLSTVLHTWGEEEEQPTTSLLCLSCSGNLMPHTAVHALIKTPDKSLLNSNVKPCSNHKCILSINIFTTC